MISLNREPAEAMGYDQAPSPLSRLPKLLGKFKRQLFPVSSLRYLQDDFEYSLSPEEFDSHIYEDERNHVVSGSNCGSEITEDSEMDEGAVGSASVICNEKSIAYAWTFGELHEFYADDPKASIILEMCMSADLNNKFLDQSASDLARKYNQILIGALLGSRISDNVREKLELKRLEMGVATAEHIRMLDELGWSQEEFKIGQKRLAAGQEDYKAVMIHER